MDRGGVGSLFKVNISVPLLAKKTSNLSFLFCKCDLYTCGYVCDTHMHDFCFDLCEDLVSNSDLKGENFIK